jgi:hypothetical protein
MWRKSTAFRRLSPRLQLGKPFSARVAQRELSMMPSSAWPFYKPSDNTELKNEKGAIPPIFGEIASADSGLSEDKHDDSRLALSKWS